MMKDIVFEIYKDSRTVFRINDIALLLNSVDGFLSQKLNKLVNNGLLLNLRKGIYAKQNYKVEELACILYTPTYISLNFVLQRSGVVFQFDSSITNVSYLSREIVVDNQRIEYRKMKDGILFNTAGIVFQNNINMATPERAFLDTLYLFGDVFFDNLNMLNINKINELMPVYQSRKIENYIQRNFNKRRHKNHSLITCRNALTRCKIYPNAVCCTDWANCLRMTI